MVKVQPEINIKTTLTYLYESILPFYKINRYLGTFGLKILKKEEEIIIQPHKSDRIYLGIAITLYTLAAIYAIFNTLQAHNDPKIAPKFLLTAQTILSIVLVFLNITCCFIFRELVIKCMELLASVDISMSQLKITVNYVTAKKYTYKILSIMLMVVTFRSLLMFGASEQSLFVQIVLFFTMFIKSMIKYILVVKLVPVLVRFNKLNQAIIASSDRTDYEKLGEDLYTLCRLHFKLCNISRRLNTAYTMQILSSLTTGLVNILFHSFYFYVVIVKKFDDANYFMIVTPVVWLLDEFFEIYFLVEACSTTGDSANSTAVILHDLRNQVKNNEIDVRIQMFSLMMLHQKLEFSVLGFFIINHSLIYSIIGAVTTYLVIFIQFDQTESRKPGITFGTEGLPNASLSTIIPF